MNRGVMLAGLLLVTSAHVSVADARPIPAGAPARSGAKPSPPRRKASAPTKPTKKSAATKRTAKPAQKLLAELPATWSPVACPGQATCGRARVVSLPDAPFPYGDRPWKNDSVYVFVPDGFRDRGTTDVVLHFHGWYTDLADTLGLHAYAQHVWASGVNAVLVVPQGPVNAPSSDIGRLEQPGATGRLVQEVLDTLTADGITRTARLGDLTLTAHSGGYAGVARALAPDSGVARPWLVGLFDALYANEDLFRSYGQSGGRLRTNWIDDSGTVDFNTRLTRALDAAPFTSRALRSAPVVGWNTRSDHWATTWADDAYAEVLRWGGRHHRKGPRVELRQAVCVRRDAQLVWTSPEDEDLRGWRVEAWSRSAPSTWTLLAELPAEATRATVPCTADARVRVMPVVEGVPAPLGSDVYALSTYPRTLVVDAVDRVLAEPTPGLISDVAARVAEAVGEAATVSVRAVLEDGFDLAKWESVVWLAGPDGGDDRALSRAERAVLESYLEGPGHLVLSGSDIAWELGKTDGRPGVVAGRRTQGEGTDGAAFLARTFGAKFKTTRATRSRGRTAGVRSFSIGERVPAYALPTLDVLGTTGKGVAAAWYADGSPAAVGLPGKAVLAGFPLELVDTPQARAAVAQRLLRFAREK